MLKLRNNKGEGLTSTMIGIVISMVILTIVSLTGLVGLSKANYYATVNDLKNFSDAIEMCLIEHPKIQMEAGQTYDSATNTWSALDATTSEKYIDIINAYLDASLVFDPATGKSAKTDKWGMSYEIYISTQDVDIDPTTKSTTKVTADSTDTEVRIIIKSLGKNSTVARTDTNIPTAVGATIDDIDDVIMIIQCANSSVKSLYYRCDEKGDQGVYFVNNTNGARMLDEVGML